jgi:branched-subunit amino acid aminotransferase/4-amino-4-deoxychorismate lyase
MIWNPEGNVMEGSRTNIYFYRVVDGQDTWVTPTDSSGCLRGTERRWLVERGMVKLQNVKKDDVQDQEIVLLSNGLRGIWAATVSK